MWGVSGLARRETPCIQHVTFRRRSCVLSATVTWGIAHFRTYKHRIVENQKVGSRGVGRFRPGFSLSASFTWRLSTGAMGRFETRLHPNLWGIQGQRQRPNRRKALYSMPSLLARLLLFNGVVKFPLLTFMCFERRGIAWGRTASAFLSHCKNRGFDLPSI